MPKILQLVIYKSITDEDKLAAYAALSGPATKAAGGRFLARGMPFETRENGEKTRTVIIEWDSIEAAERGFESEAYQAALAALDGSAVRDIRYLEMLE